MYLLGTDIGTQGTKTIMVDESGKLISQSFEEYQVLTPRPSWAEQWPNVWVDATLLTMRACIEASGVDPSQIAAIALSGLYGGSGIPVDRKMRPLGPCLIWMDRRAKAQSQWVKEHIDPELLFSITGNAVDSYYGFTKIMWIRDEQPDIWSQIDQFVTPKDYVIHHLTGELATDFTSAGNLGGVFDLKNKTWSSKMCDQLGIPMGVLPERILPSSSIVGRLRADIGHQVGLLGGTPVISGGVDAAVAQLSAGVLHEGEHVAMAGTSMCWGTVHSGENLTPGLVSFPYVVEEGRKIYTFGGSATTGAIARWFRDQFSPLEVEYASKSSLSPYSLLELHAKKIPVGSDGLIVLPYFMGERSPIWDPDAKGVFFGLSLYHTRAHLYRAILEGTAFALHHNMETAKQAGIRLDPECAIVGGVARSDFWAQIFADITGFHMKRLSIDVEAPYGDAFLAGLGVGLIKSPEEIKSWISHRPLLQSDPANHQKYQKIYPLFLSLYQQTQSLMRQISSMIEE